jgi:nucleoside-diphosphate-sugar epimerase
LKIVLLGKDGQVGWELQRALAPLGDVVALGRSDGDLREGDAVAAKVRAVAPQWIVNAAAYTAVDRAESESELAQLVNATAVGALARAAHATTRGSSTSAATTSSTAAASGPGARTIRPRRSVPTVAASWPARSSFARAAAGT